MGVIQTSETSPALGALLLNEEMCRYQLLQQLCRSPVQLVPAEGIWMAVVSRSYLPRPTWVLIMGEVLGVGHNRRDWDAHEYYVERDRRTGTCRPVSRPLQLHSREERSAFRAQTRMTMVRFGGTVEQASALSSNASPHLT